MNDLRNGDSTAVPTAGATNLVVQNGNAMGKAVSLSAAAAKAALELCAAVPIALSVANR